MTKSVTIQVSEKFEIKSKTRNILSANEFNKELKRARVLIILLVAFMVFGTIVVIGTIFSTASVIVSAIHEKMDNKAKE